MLKNSYIHTASLEVGIFLFEKARFTCKNRQFFLYKLGPLPKVHCLSITNSYIRVASLEVGVSLFEKALFAWTNRQF